MVKHIILWTIKPEYIGKEKEEIIAGIKEGLESLQGKVPGLLEIHVNTDRIDSSNMDVMLDATLQDEESLKGYSVHPDHVAIASTKVRPFTEIRSCFDYRLS